MEIGRQRVLVTGGTRGIGLAIAEAFARRGATVGVCARSRPERLDAPEVDGAMRFFACDLADPEELPRLADRVRSELEPTVLVNNAGIQLNHDWTETGPGDRAEWARLEIAVNLSAPVTLTALLLDDLLARPEAAVVNVTSLLALAPKRSAPVYSATKAGLRSFTRGLRYQLASHAHVRVVEVLPPVVDTAMTAGRGAGKVAPAEVAEDVVRGLERGRDEVWIGKARLVRRLDRIVPGVTASILRSA